MGLNGLRYFAAKRLAESRRRTREDVNDYDSDHLVKEYHYYQVRTTSLFHLQNDYDGNIYRLYMDIHLFRMIKNECKRRKLEVH